MHAATLEATLLIRTAALEDCTAKALGLEDRVVKRAKIWRRGGGRDKQIWTKFGPRYDYLNPFSLL